jgi:hypothetical protein
VRIWTEVHLNQERAYWQTLENNGGETYESINDGEFLH